MIFHRSRIKSEGVQITIRNENIRETNSIKFLGIIVDNKLKWHEHIIYIKNKVSRAIGIICKARKYANKQTVKQMYYTFVFPYLIYCCEIWGNCQLGPRYEGQLTRMAEPIPPSGQSSSYSLTTLSSSSSTDRRAETNRIVITTRIAVAHHFRCRLRRRKSCIGLLGATSSQSTLPLHELPPARLVIHRQTSAHERRKGTLSVQSRSGILADFCPQQH